MLEESQSSGGENFRYVEVTLRLGDSAVFFGTAALLSLSMGLFCGRSLADDCATEKKLRDELAQIVQVLGAEHLNPIPFELSALQSEIVALDARLNAPECKRPCRPLQSLATPGERTLEEQLKRPTIFHVEGNLARLWDRDRPREIEFDEVEFFQIPLKDGGRTISFPARMAVKNYIDYAGVNLHTYRRMSDSDLYEATLAQLEADLISLGADPQKYAQWERLKSDLKVEVGLTRFFSSADAEDSLLWQRNMQKTSEFLTDGEKKRFLATLGGDLAIGYDTDRAGISLFKAKGTRTCNEMLIAYRNGDPTGICRDIASCVGEVALTMGMKDVYVVGYGSSVPHATVLMRDPEDPKKVLKMDYNELSSANLDQGTGSLEQKRDYSMSYTLSRPGGKTVASLPSDLQLALVESTGGDTRVIDPFARQTSPLVSSLQFGNGAVRGNVVAGELLSGSRFIGIIGSNRYAGGERAAGIIYQDNPDKKSSDAAHLYGRYTAQVATPLYNVFGAAVRGVAEPVAMADLTVVRDRKFDGDVETTVGAWGSLHANVGVEGRFTSADQKTRIRGEAKIQPTVGVKDVRSADMRDMTVFNNLSWVRVEGERDISPAFVAFADLGYGTRVLGSQLFAMSGVSARDGSKRVAIGYEGAIKPDAFSVAPGMVRQWLVSAETALQGGWRVGAELRKPLQSPKTQMRLRVNKNF